MDWIFWLVLVIVLTVIELATTNLLSVWFVISGIVALILSFFIDNVAIVSTVFAVLGIILLFTTRPLLKKYLPTQQARTNADRIIGMHGVVTEEIKKNVVGEVKVDGKRWSAISNTKIPVGSDVIIDAIDGVKVVVRKED